MSALVTSEILRLFVVLIITEINTLTPDDK